ncbi:hypothetical protein, partial [Bacillus paralicheniformis]|uniref:hypothetical protein n=2 Tax=Bacillus subtilis group TaxID=653685 RepID=UPI001FD71E47
MGIGLIFKEVSNSIKDVKLATDKEYSIDKADGLLDQIDKSALKSNESTTVSYTILNDGEELVSDKIVLNGSYFGLADYYQSLLNNQTIIDDTNRYLKVLHIYNTIKIPLAENIAKFEELKEAFKIKAQQQSEPEIKQPSEEEARRKAEEQRLAEEEAKRKAEEEARRKAEEQRLAEEEAKR